MSFDQQHIFSESTRGCLTQAEIDSYVEQNMAAANLREVEMHLLDCMVCSDAIDGAMDLRELEARQTQSSSSPLKWIFRIAAVGLVLIGVVFAMKLYSAETQYETAFADAFVPYANDITATTRAVGSTNDDVDSTVVAAMAAYDQENYQEALESLKHAMAEGSDEDLLPLYAAISEIQLGHYEAALTYLDFVRVNDPDRYEEVLWYTGLVYVKLNQPTEAKEYLQQLVNESQFYSPRAQQVFEQAFGEKLSPQAIR